MLLFVNLNAIYSKLNSKMPLYVDKNLCISGELGYLNFTINPLAWNG